MTDRLCTPEEANAFHPPPRNRSAALMYGCEAGVPSCIAVVKALADKHGYHKAEIDE